MMAYLRTPRPRRARLGFTLIELLVVITIIGILMSLLLPAVQQVREAARRMQCGNNLRQLGLAMHNYEGVLGRLPYATPYSERGIGSGEVWTTALLPYLEQTALHDRFNFNVRMDHASNRTAVQVVVDTLICPSDGAGPIFDNRTNRSGGNPTPALGMWYAASMGPTHMDSCPFCPTGRNSYCCQGNNFGTTNPINNSTGMFGRYPIGVRFASVRDGLSNTFMLGETLPAECVYVCAHCTNFPLSGTSIPLNTFERVEQAGGIYYRACGFKSAHPGGANFAMGDASVHFISEGIDYQLFNHLGTRAGREVAQLP